MKMLAISIILTLGASAPALAQQGANPPVDTASAPEAAPNADETLIGEITTTEERAMMLRRCAGPPPRPIASTTPKDTPASEPAVMVERAAATLSSGG